MTSVLFVCSGNTCRSPLAAALVGEEARRRGLDVTVSSAGTLASPGAPASGGSIRAAARRGIDRSAHRARPLDGDALSGADLVLVMTPAHRSALRTRFGRELSVWLVTDCLPPGDERRGRAVEDPFGGSDERYEEVARILEECAASLLDGLSAP